METQLTILELAIIFMVALVITYFALRNIKKVYHKKYKEIKPTPELFN
jgi:F0F1-type ATP synthase membrane subunit b/b'